VQFDLQMWAKLGPLTLGAVLMTACSSGSETTTPPPPPANVAPSVEISGDSTVDEKLSGSISASATDSDGSITTYAWIQTGGTTVDLADSSAASLDFTAPIAKVEETLTFEVTITDDDGATASDNFTVTINPVNEIDFKIEGLVWDGASVPSDVTANMGGDPIVVTSDIDGNYVLDIMADEDLASQLLFLRSDASDDTEIAFHNIPVTLQALMDASGGDGVLDVSDDIGVNLTPLSTALYGAMYRQNDAVASEADVEAAIARVDGSEAVSVGAAVKIISENNGGVQDTTLGLPDGYADTIEFAIDPLGSSQFVTALKTLEPEAFDGALTGLLGDENIVEDITDPISDFPTTITMAAENVVVARMTFESATTGVYTEGGNEIDVEWSQDTSGAITITGVGGGFLRQSESMQWRSINGSFMQVRQLNTLNQVVMTPVMVLPRGVLYTHLNDITLSYPDNSADLPDEDSSRSFEITYITDSEYQDYDIDALFGGNSQIDLLTSYFSDSFNPNLGPDTGTGFGPHQTHYNADFLTLERTGTATNGTVTTQYGEDFFSGGTWEAVDAKTLRVTFSSDRFNAGETFEIDYGLINDIRATVAVRREGDLEGLHNGVFAVRDAAQLPQSDMDAEGFYVSPTPFGTGQLRWTELKASGVASIDTLRDLDGDGVLEQNELQSRSAFWSLEADGRIIIGEYRFPITRAPNCDPNVSTCLESRTSRWTIANRNGAEAYMLNELSIYFPTQSNSSVVAEAWFQTTGTVLDYSTSAPIDISALPPG